MDLGQWFQHRICERSYGPQGEASAQSMPGARYIPVTWKDASGNLWLFGGFGNDSSGTTGELNGPLEVFALERRVDLGLAVPARSARRGSTAHKMSRPLRICHRDAIRQPVGRTTRATFGYLAVKGSTAPQAFFHRLNDLWRYSPSSGEWTWIAGSNTFDATGVYGTQGVPAATNVPGARAAAYRWKDSIGNVWIFGGFQYDDSTNTRFEMNDLWKVPTQ